MTDETQFSLCWNNFTSMLSAGVHESLHRGDLVDVTLAADGQLVPAHRLVLSVCSPYFRKMLNQMPPNQHAFIFLQGVSHATLKDLIQFMYFGEVNVKQDALRSFISTAKALQIKGITEIGDEPVASVLTPVLMSPLPSVARTSPTSSPVQRIKSRSASKLEPEENVEDKTAAPVAAQNRVFTSATAPKFLYKTITAAPAGKRIKTSYPLLEAPEPTSQQQLMTTLDTNSNPEQTEPIDMLIESWPTNPKLDEAAGAVHNVEDIVNDDEDLGDSGDMDYDMCYVMENDDVTAEASDGLDENGDQSTHEVTA